MIPERLSHYRIIRKIGSGAMGEVHLAEDEVLGRRVAVKILPPDIANHPDRVARFKQEARAVSALYANCTAVAADDVASLAAP